VHHRLLIFLVKLIKKHLGFSIIGYVHKKAIVNFTGKKAIAVYSCYDANINFNFRSYLFNAK